MPKHRDAIALETKLDGMLAELLAASHGSRCTVRVDNAMLDWHVDFICAEAIRPGIRSLRNDGSIDQRNAETVKWLDKHRKNLVQPDLTGTVVPPPPPALLSAYAAKAQMLAPLSGREGELRGWISVHYVEGPHDFTDVEVAALDKSAADIQALLAPYSTGHV
jgi:maleate isomerase